MAQLTRQATMFAVTLLGVTRSDKNMAKEKYQILLFTFFADEKFTSMFYLPKRPNSSALEICLFS